MLHRLIQGKCAHATIHLGLENHEGAVSPKGLLVGTESGHVFMYTGGRYRVLPEADAVMRVEVQSIAPGADYNVGAHEITRIITPGTPYQSCTNPEAAYNGRDPAEPEDLAHALHEMGLSKKDTRRTLIQMGIPGDIVLGICVRVFQEKGTNE